MLKEKVSSEGVNPIDSDYLMQTREWRDYVSSLENVSWELVARSTVDDQVVYFLDGRVTKVVFGPNDSRKNLTIQYYRDGKIYFMTVDLGGDGTVDVRQYYRDGEVAYVDGSTRMDGKINCRWQ